jgi:hypothetical protein
LCFGANITRKPVKDVPLPVGQDEHEHDYDRQDREVDSLIATKNIEWVESHDSIPVYDVDGGSVSASVWEDVPCRGLDTPVMPVLLVSGLNREKPNPVLPIVEPLRLGTTATRSLLGAQPSKDSRCQDFGTLLPDDENTCHQYRC